MQHAQCEHSNGKEASNTASLIKANGHSTCMIKLNKLHNTLHTFISISTAMGDLIYFCRDTLFRRSLSKSRKGKRKHRRMTRHTVPHVVEVPVNVGSNAFAVRIWLP